MQGRKTALIVRIDEDTREKLLSWLRATKTPQGRAKRARAILLLAEGHSYADAARQVGLRERHVRKWAHRFLRDSPAGLDDAPRSGRPPVHCSWMNHVEQWFSILQRKRLRSVDFADKAMLAERLLAFASRWNEPAHPFNWSTKSAAKVMAQCQLSQAA